MAIGRRPVFMGKGLIDTPGLQKGIERKIKKQRQAHEKKEAKHNDQEITLLEGILKHILRETQNPIRIPIEKLEVPSAFGLLIHGHLVARVDGDDLLVGVNEDLMRPMEWGETFPP